MPGPLTSPIVDCEPPAEPLHVAPRPRECRQPPRALRRPTPRPLAAHVSHAPPRAVLAFADAALRRVLEVIDRRRPAAQLRTVLSAGLFDTVVAMTRTSYPASATLSRVRLRMVDDTAAEVFATYRRGPRVHAIAARAELRGERWRLVAFQLG